MPIIEMITRVLSGASATFIIFFTTLIISLPLGIVIMFMKKCNIRFVSVLTSMMISLLRGTPLMLQLIVWFYAPYYLFRIQLTRDWRVMAVILGFSINYASYFAEIYRGGYESIPCGQTEASIVLGYNKIQTFMRILLPQLIKRVLPPVTNEIITLIKDTSLAFVIAYAEVFTIAKQVAAAKTTIIPLFIAGAFYYIFNFIVERVMGYIEKRFSYFE
ncbi:MAG: amino acid ABC transporter permease [Lachnospiraceae bacterium]|nr:amino acid ABC transporter permease [Lachnospiraceae bacterium]